ncbi:MAG: DUF1844 domain-containing protein [Planctomycetota bacterium]|nr:MAG: DUF1844 domain-containing protein [Planctomycetota bacterium]
MAEEEKKIIVDDDWKAEAAREKERLEQETSAEGESLKGDPAFIELVNLIVMQAMAGLGMLAGPDGQRIPPNIEVAKHFIDMLQMLEDKTKGNLSEDEHKLLDQVMYEMRMRYVQAASGGGAGGAPPPPTSPPGA